MRSRPFIIWASVVVAGAGAGGWFWYQRGPAPTPGAGYPDGGRIEVAAMIDLGTVRNGEFVSASIPVTNRGHSAALLGEFRTDCSCMQVYEVREGARTQISKLTLQPGETRVVHLDIRPSGHPGVRQSSQLIFRDLDAEDSVYRVLVSYTPIARIYALPRAIVFGETPAGGAATMRVEIRSDGSYEKDVTGITSAPHDHFSSRFLAESEENRRLFARDNPGQVLLGYLDVTATAPGKSGMSDFLLIVTNGGEEMLRLPVAIHSVATYELIPDTLVLPRVQSGRPEYSARVFLRCRNEGEMQPELLDKDLPFQVDFGAGELRGPTLVVAVIYTGDRKIIMAKDYKIRIRVRDNQAETILELNVRVVAKDE